MSSKTKVMIKCAAHVCPVVSLASPLPCATRPHLFHHRPTPSKPSSTGQAGFVRYTILVTLRGQSWSIIRRFNDFIPLHNALCRSFPGFPGRLPVKKWFGRFNPDFLQDRKLQLQHYLDVVTRLPGFPESSHEGCLFFEVHVGEREA